MKKSEVKASLIEQLKAQGKAQKYNLDLIEDYMKLWSVKTKLNADIKDRGVVYEDVSSVGIKMQKNNPSVKELVMVNRQMLSIIKELGVNETENVGGDDDEM